MRAMTIVGILTLLITGCAAVPKITYHKYSGEIPQPDLKGYPKFKLASSLITVESAVDKNRDVEGLTIRSVPTEDATGESFGLIEVKQFGIKANIGVEFFDNSMILKSVSTNTEDKRAEMIQQIGGIIAKGIALTAAEPGALPKDFRGTIDLATVLKTTKIRESFSALDKLPTKEIGLDNPKAQVTILELGPISADSVERTAYPFTTEQSTYIYSACRDAKIQVSLSGRTYAATVRIADPNFIQTIAYPVVGTVSAHSSCGVSVKANKTESPALPQIIDALITQGKAIRDAQHPAGAQKPGDAKKK